MAQQGTTFAVLCHELCSRRREQLPHAVSCSAAATARRVVQGCITALLLGTPCPSRHAGGGRRAARRGADMGD